MKLSENMKNYIEICKNGKNSLNTMGILYSYLPKVEQLEKENEELKNLLKAEYNTHNRVGITDDLYDWNRIVKKIIDKL